MRLQNPSSLKYLIILFSFAILSCNDQTAIENQSESVESAETATSSIFIKDNSTDDDSIDVKLYIEKIDSDFLRVNIQMNLYGDTWIVCPLEKDYPYGGMTINFNANDHFLLMDSIHEDPASQYKTDPNWDGDYRVISGKTTLSQKIKLQTTEDFETSGDLFFVLEPICSPIEIYFKIIQKDNVLTIQQEAKVYPTIDSV